MSGCSENTRRTSFEPRQRGVFLFPDQQGKAHGAHLGVRSMSFWIFNPFWMGEFPFVGSAATLFAGRGVSVWATATLKPRCEID